MTSMNWKSLLAVVAAGTLAIGGCSGADGKDGINGVDGQDGQNGQNGQDGATGPVGPTGPQGPAGPTGPTGPTGPAGQDLLDTAKAESCEVCHPNAGSQHQALYNSYADGIDQTTTKFAVSDVSLAIADSATAGKKKATVTFTLKKNGVAFTGAPSTLKQKTVYFVTYDAATKKFPTPAYKQAADVDPDGTLGGTDAGSVVNFSFGSMTAVAGTPGVFTMVKDGLNEDPVAAASNAFLYGYFGDAVVAGLEGNLNPGGRHYALMDNMVSFSAALKGAIDYTSTANVSGCEKCHGAPYSKHGYRQAAVAGLPDMVACKACHTDFRRGTDAAWFLLADDPAAYAAQGGTPTAAQTAKYAYVANIMNDTHNSHAFEFAYPQSMSNCDTCHAGKLDLVINDAHFTPTTCKSCHPVTATGGVEAGRAPALTSLVPAAMAGLHPTNWYTTTAEDACNGCHKAGGAGKDFSEIHSGYDKTVHPTAATSYADTIKVTIDTAAFDAATSKLTVNFSVSGAAANALVKPTVVMSLYGYDSKDFIVGGHASQPAPDGKRNLEWAEGASGNSPRLTVVPGATAGTTWVATADLSLWAAKLADGSVKRMEIGVLPVIGLDQTKAVVTTAGATYNPPIAAAGITRTFDLVAKALVPDASSYGKKIVDPAKCNKCHEALGTTFHSPAYGSAGVVGCRLCHVVGSGGSHLELQSRSIDSYVHSIHSMQAFDMASINFADSIQKLRYEEHIDSVYPNFSIKNCESCHYAGTYEIPNQAKSMPGILSASATLTTLDRAIGVVPSYVTGPGSRACGSCHRAQMIKEDEAALLVAFNEHTHSNGTLLVSTTGVWDAAVAKIMALFK